jgi:DNA-binding MarR family transcriptional regulator
MKHKPRLTVPLGNELQVLLLFRDNKEATINGVFKLSGMHRKTFFETKARLKSKGLLTYEINGKGKRAKNIVVTESGFGLINQFIRYVKVPGRISRDQFEKARKLINQDIVHNGKIKLWRCPVHPNAEISYTIKYYGIFAYCNEKGCKKSNHWNNR